MIKYIWYKAFSGKSICLDEFDIKEIYLLKILINMIQLILKSLSVQFDLIILMELDLSDQHILLKVISPTKSINSMQSSWSDQLDLVNFD